MSSETNSPKTISVGRVKDAHNLKGEVYIKLVSEKPRWLDQIDKQLWIADSEKGPAKAYSFHRLRLHKQGFIVHFDNFENRNQAEELKGSFVHVPDHFLKTESQTDFYLVEILNFKVKLEGTLKDAEIVGFSDNRMQDLIQVKTPCGVFDVPLVDEFILQIDYQEKTIDMQIPEGLVEWEK